MGQSFFIAGLAALATIAAARADVLTEAERAAVGDAAAASPTLAGAVLVGDATGANSFVPVGVDPADGAPYAPDDTWRWASVTKQILAVLVMQDVEAGRYGLDASLGDVAPEFSVPGAEAVTVEDLLRHTSGLGAPAALPASTDVDPVAHCAVKRRAKPKTRFAYNNCDFVLLGAITERANGRPWPDLLRSRIFEPAGMAGTRVATALGEDGAVTGYVAEGQPEDATHPALYGAAAALYGPPADLVRFNAALAGGRLLGAAARAQLWDGDPAFGYVALGAWSFEAPLAGCTGPLRLIERRGAVGGVQARNFIAPDRGRSVVIFANRADQDFGEVWMGAGLSYDVLAAALCAAG
ncbi:MAG: serine hydrolase domain-containing protein [Pseudomonadota bacterium]